MTESEKKEKKNKNEGVKPSKKTPKQCPKKKYQNDPAWYTADGVPLIGANFGILQSLEANQETGYRMDTMIHHRVVLSAPVDADNSFWQKVNEFYADIREKNAGAANYGPADVAAYMLNMEAARAWFIQGAKMMQAMGVTAPGFDKSAWLMPAAAGVYNYGALAGVYAAKFNELALIAKELEALPCVPMTHAKRVRHVLGSIFKDSQSAKPVYINFHLMETFKFSVNEGAITATRVGNWNHSASTVSNILGYIAQYISLLTDPSTPYAILRGDIRNAFGDKAMQRDLVSFLSGELKIVDVDDDEIMSQLENASILGTFQGSDESDFSQTIDTQTGGITLTLPLAGINDPKIKAKMEMDFQPINWHKKEAPTPGELMAITRFMPVGEHINKLTKSVWNITATDGLTIFSTVAVTAISRDSVTIDLVSRLMAEAQNDDAAAVKKLAFYATVCDHFPLVITDAEEAYGMAWDVDNFANVDKPTLRTITSRVVRSLFDVHAPRGEHGRLEKSA